MFSDPVVASMVMLLLCFTGILVMFVFVIRALSSLGEEVREAFRKQQMFLADLERQFLEMSFTLRRMQGEDGGEQAAAASGQLPLLNQSDDLLSMLEAAARKTPAGGLGFDDHLLPPSQSRSPAEEYDPAKDPHLFEDPFLSGTSGSSGYARGTGASSLGRGLKRDKR